MLISGGIYHIYNHAIADELLFREESNYSFFISRYNRYISPVAETYGWCLMPNHFHLLVRLRCADDLQGLIDLQGFACARTKKSPEHYATQQFSNFFNSYCKAYNKMFQRRGSLFLKNFRYKPVYSDSQLLRALLYIHNNSVKHGFTLKPEFWSWSSYEQHFGQKKTLIELSPKIAELFQEPSRYYSLHELAACKYSSS